MVTLEQKLSLFKKLVDEKVQKVIDEQILNKDDEIKDFLEKEKQILESNANRTKKAAIERIKRQKSEAISTMIQQERKLYLKKNEEILRDLLAKIEDKIRDFMQTDKYKEHIEATMLTSLEAFSSEEHIYVYIPPTNFNKAKEAAESALKKAGFENYTIIEAELNYIGGFVLENERQTIRLNKTFAEALYLKREDLGQMLHDAIRRGETL